MNIKALSLLILFSLQHFVIAQERSIYRDNSGKIVGTSYTVNNKTVYRDSSGKLTGHSVYSKQSGTRSFDATGKPTGRSNSKYFNPNISGS